MSVVCKGYTPEPFQLSSIEVELLIVVPLLSRWLSLPLILWTPLRLNKALLSLTKLGPCARTRTQNAQVVQKASLSLTLSQVSRHSGFRPTNLRIQQKWPPYPPHLPRWLFCLWLTRRREPTSTRSQYRSLLANRPTRTRILDHPPQQSTSHCWIWPRNKLLVLPLVHWWKHLRFRWRSHHTRVWLDLRTRTPCTRRSTQQQ